ncbi:hypothetical protein QTN47_07965 [Danxiaibacter flavus]|uniref:DUF4350 domain-containing protein n=1 Tax=Danxiaibacter flavus TaxID=3049108 RepID=A0ABV3ZD63_9BACT|nr:hypothetical protein QNM32_07965 [Chitinophagaceae bacterium DXS]
MKKNIPYIIIGLVALLVTVLVALFAIRPKGFDERVTLTRKGKNPYGTFITYAMLPEMFGGAEMNISRVSPLQWDNKNYVDNGHTLMFLISRQFNPNKEELAYLNKFVKSGNTIFICSPSMSYQARAFFKLQEEGYYENMGPGYNGYLIDSGKSRLLHPPFPGDEQLYFNPGFQFASFFNEYDSSYYKPLGKNSNNNINYLQLHSGQGNFFFHSNPFLFANYFLLQGNNIDYLKASMSLIPASTKKIIWDEYFVYKLPENERPSEPSPFKELLRHPAFRWALFLALALLALYALLNVKRLQRIIPVMEKPRNDSLDFVQTIGRLYYEKSDHINLANKMIAFFLEHLRGKYLIQTNVLDDQFIKSLSAKSGYDEEKTRSLVYRFQEVQSENFINEAQLNDLYISITEFYKTTA